MRAPVWFTLLAAGPMLSAAFHFLTDADISHGPINQCVRPLMFDYISCSNPVPTYCLPALEAEISNFCAANFAAHQQSVAIRPRAPDVIPVITVTVTSTIDVTAFESGPVTTATTITIFTEKITKTVTRPRAITLAAAPGPKEPGPTIGLGGTGGIHRRNQWEPAACPALDLEWMKLYPRVVEVCRCLVP